MKNNLDLRKATHSQVDDPEFRCVYQTQIPTFPKLYQVHQFKYVEIQINRD